MNLVEQLSKPYWVETFIFLQHAVTVVSMSDAVRLMSGQVTVPLLTPYVA